MSDILIELQEIIKQRQEQAAEKSYTAYLLEQGMDKILKKVGEESAETIIAAKNLHAKLEGESGRGVAIAKEELIGELGDLLYHLCVLCVHAGIDVEEIAYLLRGRMTKQGNLKETKLIDRNS